MVGIKLLGNGRVGEVLNKHGHYLVCLHEDGLNDVTVVCYSGNQKRKKTALREFKEFLGVK